ncbi:hypothetical protein BB561_000845 [Smittium simulii]|uniref:PCI domain-containing protein n=1 Tax=Smittium simulii TaxID=133385 RepID=A0A2T9YXF2_9FUNG|nr:hypothetical protein BB561_000845 [Smittium simulii]
METEILLPVPKMERSYELETKEALQISNDFAAAGNLHAAIEQLLPLEKKTRKASDVASNSAILTHIVEMCFSASNWTVLCEQLTTLSESHGKLDQSISQMVKKAITFVDQTPDQETQIEYIITLRKITEGRMLNEAERVQLTRRLAGIYHGQDKIEQASEVMQEDQIETYGSLDKHTKVEFILEQMQMCLLCSDYSRMAIVSRKINVSYFNGTEVDTKLNPTNTKLNSSDTDAKLNQNDSTDADTKLKKTQEILVKHKLQYYDLMIKLGVHMDQFLQVSMHYNRLFATKAIRNNASLWPKVLVRAVIFCVLAKYDNEQYDLLQRYISLEELDKLPQCNDFARLFVSKNLIVWADMLRNFASLMRGEDSGIDSINNLPAFNADSSSAHQSISDLLTVIREPIFSETTATGTKHLKSIQDRAIEHNIRVISKYYSRISLERLAQLVSLDVASAEEKLCGLVVDGSVYAKIDRPRQIINFVQPKSVSETLDVWVSDVNGLLGLVEKTCHLVEKENILYNIAHCK